MPGILNRAIQFAAVLLILCATQSLHAEDDTALIYLRPSVFDPILARSDDSVEISGSLSEYDSLSLLAPSERWFWGGLKYGAKTFVNDASIYIHPLRGSTVRAFSGSRG